MPTPRNPTKPRRSAPARQSLLAVAETVLEDGKAEDVVVIDLDGRSSFADHLLIASGRSQRQVLALADHLIAAVKAAGYRRPSAEGMPLGDWVLIDAGDLVVHLFRPDVREHYNLEKMWGAASAEPAELAQ